MKRRTLSGLLAVLLAVVALAPAGHLVVECPCASAAQAASRDCCPPADEARGDCCPPAEDGCDACPLCLASDPGDHAPAAVLAEAGRVQPPRVVPGVACLPEAFAARAALAAGPRVPDHRGRFPHVPRHVASTILRV